MRKMFLNTLYVVLHVTVVTKTFLSVLSLSLSAKQLKKLMAKARHFETSRNFVPLPEEKQLITKSHMRLWGQSILVLVFVVIRNMDMMYMVEIKNIPVLLVLNLVLGAASVLLVVYDGAYSAVLKALVEIFLSYLKKEVHTLKMARHATGQGATAILESCRLDVNYIQAGTLARLIRHDSNFLNTTLSRRALGSM
ncbi:hypothetical protein HPB48_019895 [Haemaphysalis longicornis]|uniref:Uncharacterized protein n=1 Tax=Haemaphysalis longicornis TaxID=44386 RepID=A0A9J6GN68_HAELO|nr:hypothetical protein HPB48_019895 [Haemaphysalis longicornis]